MMNAGLIQTRNDGVKNFQVRSGDFKSPDASLGSRKEEALKIQFQYYIDARILLCSARLGQSLARSRSDLSASLARAGSNASRFATMNALET